MGASNELFAEVPLPPHAVVIEVRVAELRQLFNAIDPSPFRERDLDPKAEEFIVAWARETPPDASLALRVQLDRLPGGTDEATMLRDAIQSFFANRAQSTRGRLRLLFRLAVMPIRVTYLGGGPPDAWRRDWPATGQAADSRK